MLDDLYAYAGKLGVVFADPGNSGPLTIKVWAPTAQSLGVLLYTNATDTTPSGIASMIEKNGVWTANIDQEWIGKYYLLREQVYAPSTRAIVINLVTDPYSTDLAVNGAKSRITDLDASANTPSGWQQDVAPTLARLNDLSIYELHVRDFSGGDATVPAAHRGTYLAFTDTNADGMKHLKTLASAGLKAIHLLPTFHFNSISEDKSTWAVTPDLSIYPPDGQQQQAAVATIQGKDAYNWGYDPDHYLVPEGGYATNPDNRVF